MRYKPTDEKVNVSRYDVCVCVCVCLQLERYNAPIISASYVTRTRDLRLQCQALYSRGFRCSCLFSLVFRKPLTFVLLETSGQIPTRRGKCLRTVSTSDALVFTRRSQSVCCYSLRWETDCGFFTHNKFVFGHEALIAQKEALRHQMLPSAWTEWNKRRLFKKAETHWNGRSPEIRTLARTSYPPVALRPIITWLANSCFWLFVRTSWCLLYLEKWFAECVFVWLNSTNGVK